MFVCFQATKNKKVLRKVEGVTPAARRQFRINEKKRLESLEDPEENLTMQGLGKLLVRRPQELLLVQPRPGPRGLAGVSNSPRSTGRGRGRGKKKKEEVSDH